MDKLSQKLTGLVASYRTEKQQRLEEFKKNSSLWKAVVTILETEAKNGDRDIFIYHNATQIMMDALESEGLTVQRIVIGSKRVLRITVAV